MRWHAPGSSRGARRRNSSSAIYIRASATWAPRHSPEAAFAGRNGPRKANPNNRLQRCTEPVPGKFARRIGRSSLFACGPLEGRAYTREGSDLFFRRRKNRSDPFIYNKNIGDEKRRSPGESFHERTS